LRGADLFLFKHDVGKSSVVVGTPRLAHPTIRDRYFPGSFLIAALIDDAASS
jgi:hypothetical protein